MSPKVLSIVAVVALICVVALVTLQALEMFHYSAEPSVWLPRP